MDDFLVELFNLGCPLLALLLTLFKLIAQLFIFSLFLLSVGVVLLYSLIEGVLGFGKSGLHLFILFLQCLYFLSGFLHCG